MNYASSIVTQESIILMFDEGARVVKNHHPKFEEVKKLVLEGKPFEALELFDISSKLQKHDSGDFFVLDNMVYLKQDDNQIPMPEGLSGKVVAFAENGIPYKPLIKFWENVQKNPNVESVKDLWEFLNHNNIPITEDGCFVAYKRVNEDYTSTVRGKWVKDECGEWYKDVKQSYDNTPGKRVEMPREQIDNDRNRTCSSGLHVAAFEYANTFYSNGKLLEVKVNPADVVSVPVDYNQQKMRTCGYDVIREAAGPREDVLYDWNNEIEDDYEDDEKVFDDDYEDDFDYEENNDMEDNMEFDYEETIPLDQIKNDSVNLLDRAIETIEVEPDSQGRVCLPARMVRALGLTNGDAVDVFVSDEEDSLGVFPHNSNSDDKLVYSVDCYDNVRLTKNATKLAKLDNKKVSVSLIDNEFVLVQDANDVTWDQSF